ncbi:alpha/beta fold hydrolase [Burkholderia sp. WSM2230]|uniref:alpha/beta fold hydrolase n=1 Tax=Burkholderia sp. WSM2230 TaxID=944435 RepID=UPI0004183E73|nr:alpha/beta fold hydrolase [Burkholderia sp. WSM2230]
MITLSRTGSFFVGGRPVTVTGRAPYRVTLSSTSNRDFNPNGTFWIEAAYVQYFLQATPRYSVPLVLVHGGGLTGSMWEDTPDGRPGWLQRLLEQGVSVYVVDNVERGRAGFCALEDVWPDRPLSRSDEESAAIYRFGYAGHRFPLDAMQSLSARTVPRWPTTIALQRQALIDVVRRIGPCVLLGFSQGGGLVFDAADATRDLTRACIALEPHGMPASFDGSLPDTPALVVFGDFIEEDEAWRMHAARANTSIVAWNAAGGRCERLDLPSLGIRGNTHMMMMDTNSDDVLHVVMDWLDDCAGMRLRR